MLASTQIAKKARESYALTKAIVLEDVADGKRTALDAIETLEKQYASAAAKFLRLRAHARSVWNEHGPLAELEEVRRAYVSGEANWNALLERVRNARKERTNVG